MTLVSPAVIDGPPKWATALTEEDWGFVKRFLVASGSLKDMAEQYSVSYPTVRSRLDRLIAKIQLADRPKSKDPFEQMVRILVADGQLSPPLAKDLLAAHRQSIKKGSK